ncbi:hypothetical protein CI105_08905 [Candidatus Izimaplasma bacterium ZiA1]|uniref:restriction endonuclease subunit S n=1 Tax=Candidatus Izimoplasma sp. ZiA1 TaxID=2024899 RepID=UPI000BAA397D|nr:hypothetical protein CI105_08905 [Candidatus Izimaplasma bacterium ZiA1]
MENDKVQHLRNEPKIRFSEFRDDWVNMLTGDLLEFKNGINAEKQRFGHGKSIINYKDAFNNEYADSSNVLGLVDFTDNEFGRYSVQKNDILFTRTSETLHEIGYSCSINEITMPTIFSGFLLRGRPKQDNLVSPFSGYLYRTHHSRNEIIKKSSYTTRALTNGTLLSEVIVNIPKVEEQIKIGSFLTALDMKIELLQKKYENLKLFKKGLIEEIFKELRTEYPIKKLIDVSSKMFSGGTPKSTEKKYYDGDINFLSIADITKSSKNLYNASKRITQLGLDNSSAKVAIPGTMIYTMYATIAVPIITRIHVAIPQSVMAIHFKDEIDIDFMYYQLASMISKIRSEFTETGTQGNINSSIVKNLKLVVPHYERQIEISKKLNYIESKVELLSSNIEILKQFKKGLLQQMFI